MIKKIMIITSSVLVLLVGGLATAVVLDKWWGPADTSERTAQVEVYANGFLPGTLSIKPNTKVTWYDTVKPGEGVVLSASTGTNEKGAIIEPKDEVTGGYSRVFTKPGTYTFYHPGNPDMKGTVVVEE